MRRVLLTFLILFSQFTISTAAVEREVARVSGDVSAPPSGVKAVADILWQMSPADFASFDRAGERLQILAQPDDPRATIIYNETQVRPRTVLESKPDYWLTFSLLDSLVPELSVDNKSVDLPTRISALKAITLRIYEEGQNRVQKLRERVNAARARPEGLNERTAALFGDEANSDIEHYRPFLDSDDVSFLVQTQEDGAMARESFQEQHEQFMEQLPRQIAYGEISPQKLIQRVLIDGQTFYGFADMGPNQTFYVEPLQAIKARRAMIKNLRYGNWTDRLLIDLKTAVQYDDELQHIKVGDTLLSDELLSDLAENEDRAKKGAYADFLKARDAIGENKAQWHTLTIMHEYMKALSMVPHNLEFSHHLYILNSVHNDLRYPWEEFRGDLKQIRLSMTKENENVSSRLKSLLKYKRFYYMVATTILAVTTVIYMSPHFLSILELALTIVIYFLWNLRKHDLYLKSNITLAEGFGDEMDQFSKAIKAAPR